MQTRFTYSFDENDLDGTQRYYGTRDEAYRAASNDFEDQCIENFEDGSKDVWISEVNIRNNDENEILTVWPTHVEFNDDGYPSYEDQVRATYYGGAL